MLSVTWFLNNFREAQNDFPKIIFTYYESLLLVVFSPSVLKNSDQRHMMKIVAFFNWRIYGKYILPRNKLIWVDSKILVKNGIAISPRWLLQKVKWTVHATAISDHFFCYCSVLTNNLNQSAQITSWVIHMKKDHPLRHVQDGVKLAQK